MLELETGKKTIPRLVSNKVDRKYDYIVVCNELDINIMLSSVYHLCWVLTGVVVARRRQGERSPPPGAGAVGPPHPQLYSTEPSKRNGKTLTPPDGNRDITKLNRRGFLERQRRFQLRH